MTLGGAAQVAAAHCPNEWTLDPAVCSQTDPLMPQPATLWPSPPMFSGNDSLFLVASITRILIATHLPTPARWKTELA